MRNLPFEIRLPHQTAFIKNALGTGFISMKQLSNQFADVLEGPKTSNSCFHNKAIQKINKVCLP